MEKKKTREMLSATKLKADEQLKNRIIHQINAEKALIPKVQKTVQGTSYGHFYILGIMYILLLCLFAYYQFEVKVNPFESKTYVLSTLLIASIFSFYWLSVVYRDYKKLSN